MNRLEAYLEHVTEKEIFCVKYALKRLAGFKDVRAGTAIHTAFFRYRLEVRHADG